MSSFFIKDNINFSFQKLIPKIGSTWSAYITAQDHPWMAQAYRWRLFFGITFLLSYFVLMYDLITAGRRVEELKKEAEVVS